jgi:hypothetical protein
MFGMIMDIAGHTMTLKIETDVLAVSVNGSGA